MKCFYHNDIDGRCAGSVVAKYNNDYNKDNFFEVDYNMEIPIDKIEPNESVWFVDYSFTEKTKHVLDKLIEKGCKIIWLDHHQSSIELEEKYSKYKNIEGIRDINYCGAMLTYMYCNNIKNPNVTPLYIKLVDDFDCWKQKLENSDFFKLAIELNDYDALDKLWLDLEQDHPHNDYVQRLCEYGTIIKRYIDNDNDRYREQYSYESEFEGHKCLVVNKRTNSWVFGKLIDEYPIVLIWVFDGIRYNYSIYSSQDIDCSKLAQKYGGGGHKGAAGFNSDKLLLLGSK